MNERKKGPGGDGFNYVDLSGKWIDCNKLLTGITGRSRN